MNLSLLQKVSAKLGIRTATAVLVLILLFGLALRLVFFNGLGFVDDLAYAQNAHALPIGGQYVHRDPLGHRIGTWYPAAFTLLWFGVNDFGLVAYPLAMSLVSIVVVYLLGRQLFSECVGLLAAFLLSFYPLDVELSTRLLPDGLLSAFSLLAIYFLFTADLANLENGGDTLRKSLSYLWSGMFLGYCATVNMSTFVLVVFVVVYFVFSFVLFREHTRRLGFRNALRRINGPRAMMLAAGFLTVAALEGLLYLGQFGNPFQKYLDTFAHYNREGREFCQDLWEYPRAMFLVDWRERFRFLRPEEMAYGFFFLPAVPALAAGLWRRNSRYAMVALWLCCVWAYLEWGTMDFPEWSFLHRRPRHLAMLTPALMLCLAFPLAAGTGRLRRAIAGAVVALLLATSVHVIYRVHQYGRWERAPMEAAHELVEKHRPPVVFADEMTLGFLGFFDRFQDCGRTYLPLRYADSYHFHGSVAVLVHSRPAWRAEPDPGVFQTPAHWELAEARISLSPRYQAIWQAQVFRWETESARETAERSLRDRCPEGFPEGSKLFFAWHDVPVAEAEAVVLRGREYGRSKEGAFDFYEPIPREPGWRYDIIKEAGRGEVRITEQPTESNGYALSVTADDTGAPGEGRYSFFVVGRKTE